MREGNPTVLETMKFSSASEPSLDGGNRLEATF